MAAAMPVGLEPVSESGIFEIILIAFCMIISGSPTFDAICAIFLTALSGIGLISSK